MEEYKERNLMVYEEHLKGMSFTDLGKKYSISTERARSIYEYVVNKKENQQNRVYRLLFELADSEMLATKTFTVLKRIGVDTEDKLKELSIERLKGVRQCGAKTKKLIIDVRNTLIED